MLSTYKDGYDSIGFEKTAISKRNSNLLYFA